MRQDLCHPLTSLPCMVEESDHHCSGSLYCTVRLRYSGSLRCTVRLRYSDNLRCTVRLRCSGSLHCTVHLHSAGLHCFLWRTALPHQMHFQVPALLHWRPLLLCWQNPVPWKQVLHSMDRILLNQEFLFHISRKHLLSPFYLLFITRMIRNRILFCGSKTTTSSPDHINLHI